MMTPEEIIDKILEGTQLAIDRLLEKKSKEDGYVVISENGKVVKVKARTILENREKKSI
ncbi:MAG: hypothetical protein ABI169_12275 [Chitinophagaceae bacterium]